MELEEIIEGCFKGSRKHQEALYRQFSRQMYGICMLYLKNRDDASDVLHNGFLKIFTGFGKFDRNRSLEAWMRTIMVNTAIDHLRRVAKFRMVEIEEGHLQPDTANSPLEAMKLNDLRAMIDQLPDGARTVFNLYTVEGYNHREIAAKLEISEGTSKSQYSRARSLLQDMLAKKNAG